MNIKDEFGRDADAVHSFNYKGHSIVSDSYRWCDYVSVYSSDGAELFKCNSVEKCIAFVNSGGNK